MNNLKMFPPINEITVAEFLDSFPSVAKPPVVGSNASLEEVVRVMLKGCRRRIVYVVDDNGRLTGAITLTDLKDIIFRYHLRNKMGNSGVLTEHISEIFCCEMAMDCMNADIPSCRPHEGLSSVLDRMMEYDTTDIPVIDDHDKILASLDILDIMELWLRSGAKAI